MELHLPQKPGIYRLFAYVHDNHGGAAMANTNLRVSDKPQAEAPGLKQPKWIVHDGSTSPWTPSGFMGQADAIHLDDKSVVQPHSGASCLEVRYEKNDGWGGVAWQDPVNDWGDKAGGADLTGAKALVFWARGAQGGEMLKLGTGLIKDDKPFHDTVHLEKELTLTTNWTEYRLDLSGQDLSRVKTGLWWSLAGQGKPVTFYLDDVRFE